MCQTYCWHVIKMASLCAISEFFKNRTLAKLFDKHSWWYPLLKVLSSIQKPTNWFVLKINWLVSECDDVFCKSLMGNSYSCCQFSQLLWQHTSGTLSSSLNNLGGPFLAITTLLDCLLFSVFKLSRVKVLETFNLMYVVWVISQCPQ